MKKNPVYTYLMLLAAVASFAGPSLSCNKTEKVYAPSLEVLTEKVVYNVNDTVLFTLKGNPELITFYSGEVGNDYAYATIDRVYPLKVTVSFQTQVARQGLPLQEDQLRVKVATDLNLSAAANYADSLAELRRANWNDITSRFTLCALSTGTANPYEPSGEVDITGLFTENKPLFFAFQYINRPYTAYGVGNIWRVNNFSMLASADDGSSSTLLAQTANNWSLFYVGEGWNGSGSGIGSSVITMRGVRPTNEIEQELWCIGKRLEVGKELNMGHDRGVAVKGLGDAVLTSYKHVFTTPGKYNVVFIGTNSSVYGKQEIVRPVEITVQ